MVLTSASRWVPCQMRQTLAASVFWPMHQCKHFDGTLLAFWFLGSEKYRSISGVFFSESSLRMPKCFCTSRHIWNHDPWLPQLRGYVETKSQKAMWNRRVTSLAMINVLVSNWNHVLHASAWDENCFLLFPVPSFMSRLASQCHRLYRQLVVTCHLSTENMHISYLDIFRPCTVKLTQGYTGHYLKPWPCRINAASGLQAAYSGPTSDTRVASAARFHRGPLFSPHLARSFFSCCWMACLNATASGLETWVFLA